MTIENKLETLYNLLDFNNNKDEKYFTLLNLLKIYTQSKLLSKNSIVSIEIQQYYQNCNENLKLILINHIKQHYSHIININ